MSDTSLFEFVISQEEMVRRKRAFTTLSSSIFLSVTLCSIDYLVTAPRVALPSVAILALLLLLSRRSIHRSTNKFGQRKVILSDTSVRSVCGSNASSEIAFEAIRGMRVKTTVKNTIREITLKTSDGMRFGLNGLSDFDRLRDELTERLDQQVNVTELREPIDFDHPWFYIVFGAFVGCATAGLVRLAPLVDYGMVRIVNLAISVFIASAGILWLRIKPGVATYGPTTLKADRLFGTVLIGIGLLLGAHALFLM